MKKGETVAAIIERCDELCHCSTDYRVEHGKVYWATCNDFDRREVQLVVLPVDEFIKKNSYWLEE